MMSTMVMGSVNPVWADTLGACELEAVSSVKQVLSGDEESPIRGYLKQLEDLLSTNMSTYLLIDEVQVLVRDARIEMRGICREVEKFDEMSEHMDVAYGLKSCGGVQKKSQNDLQRRQDLIDTCFRVADDGVNALMDSLAGYLVTQAVRTSTEPVVARLRALNGKLTVLMSSYSRLVNNFFTFSFRLGGVITGERD